MFAFDKRINLGLRERTTVHRHELLSLVESNVQLPEFGLDLGGLQILLLLRVRVVFDCDLFITSAADGDTEFQVGSDLAKFF